MGGRPECWRLPVAASLLFFLLAGCSGHRRVLETCYTSVQAGDIQGALTGLDQSSLARSGGSRLLYLMERGVLLRLQGDYQESNRVLEDADLLADELFTRSLSAESFSFVINDNVIPYAGEDYESCFLNYYKALNFLALGDLEAARVEARKVDEKLNYFTDQYGGRNALREIASLRFLTGLIYEAENDPNNAFIAYRRSLEAYRGYPGKYQTEVPEPLWGRMLATARRTGFHDEHQRYLEEARAAGVDPVEAETFIAVLIDSGFVPVKREAFILVPTDHGFPVKLALPQFEPRPSPTGAVEVFLDGQERVRAERIEDIGAIARQSLEDKKGRILAKMAARAVAKQLAARRAEKEYGPVAGLAAQVAALVTEQADLRSWTLLPDQILLALVPTTPGCHTVVISRGTHHEIHTVEVAAGSLGFVMTRIR